MNKDKIKVWILSISLAIGLPITFLAIPFEIFRRINIPHLSLLYLAVFFIVALLYMRKNRQKIKEWFR